MFDNIHTQIILTGEKLKDLAQWFIPIGVSITAIIISFRRNREKDNEKKLKEIEINCEKLIEKMEATLTKSIDEKDANNWRAHGEIRTELETHTNQMMALIKSIDDNVKILLAKKK